MNVLKGASVILRAVEPQDADLLFKWENDGKNWQVSNTITPFSKRIIEEYVESAKQDIFENKQLRLMIDKAEDNQTIGTIDLFDFEPLHSRAGVGILIHQEEDRAKGYASESLKLMSEYCKNTLIIKQLYCQVSEKNIVSQKLFEKLGYEKTGTLKSWVRTSPMDWESVFIYQKVLF